MKTNCKTQTGMKKNQKALQADWEAKAKTLIEVGKQIEWKPTKPSADDLRFHRAMKKAMQLDGILEPAIKAIYRRLRSALSNEMDRELFEILQVLQVGSTISAFAPRHLVSTSLITNEPAGKLYTDFARKAERLLKATQEKGSPKDDQPR